MAQSHQPAKERMDALRIVAAWAMLNLWQAASSPLTEDEAYYWMYSQCLDWGYFDHPPMIALFIAAGQWLGGVLGVRLMTAAAQTAALWILWRMAQVQWPEFEHKARWFLGIGFSIVIFQVFGFIATPDAPLLFFTSVFFWVYRRFAQQASALNAVWLGLVSAGLMYSKYHGALLIGFTVLSHSALWRKWPLYLAGAVGLLCFAPHLWWQYAHDFPSFRYHLVQRSQEFKWWYVGEFLLNILLIFNPLIWPLAWKALRAVRWSDVFERALAVNLVGFLLFFFASTFRGHVQPQWVAAVSVPMWLLVYIYVLPRRHLHRYARRVILGTLIIVVLARLLLAFSWLPLPGHLHQQRAFAQAVAVAAGERPVIFSRSYQRASLYAFYTGHKEVFSAGTYKSRRSQFDLWDMEAAMHLRPVLWVGGQSHPKKKYFLYEGDTITYTEIDTFYAFYKVQPLAAVLPDTLRAGDTLALELTLHNPYSHLLPMAAIPRLQLVACWMHGAMYKQLAEFVPVACSLPELPPGQTRTVQAVMKAPELPSGRYKVGFAFQYEDITPLPVGNWQYPVLTQERK